jgi:hypothetical protein
MQSFQQFLENRLQNELIKEAAQLCVELDINPAEFILNMDFDDLNEQDQQPGFFGRLKNAASQFASNVWSGGGIKGGFQMAKDTMAGPSQKYAQAVKTLEALTNTLLQNPATQNMKLSNNRTPVTQFLQRVIGELKKQQQMVPKLYSADATAAAPTYKQPKTTTPSTTPSTTTPSTTP